MSPTLQNTNSTHVRDRNDALPWICKNLQTGCRLRVVALLGLCGLSSRRGRRTGDQVVRLAESGSASAKAHDARDALRALVAAGAPPDARRDSRAGCPRPSRRRASRRAASRRAGADGRVARAVRAGAGPRRAARGRRRGDADEPQPPRVGRVIQRPLPHQRPGLFGMPSHPRGGGGGGGGLANAAKRSGETVMQARRPCIRRARAPRERAEAPFLPPPPPPPPKARFMYITGAGPPPGPELAKRALLDAGAPPPPPAGARRPCRSWRAARQPRARGRRGGLAGIGRRRSRDAMGDAGPARHTLPA